LDQHSAGFAPDEATFPANPTGDFSLV